MQFINLHNLQNAPYNFEIMHVGFGNFWPKPDPNLNLNHDLTDPSPNASQIV